MTALAAPRNVLVHYMARALVPGARHWPLAALVLASALWGGAVACTKYALRAFDPVTLLSVELVAATAALWESC